MVRNMQYVVFSMALVVVFILGMTYGLFLVQMIKKSLVINDNEKVKEPVQTVGINNITPDIMNEWLNGKGGE